MREFLLYSRTGYTNGSFGRLMEGGRLDVLYQCILMSIFRAASHRHDTVFHAVLNGPPTPPLHIAITGNDLRDARIDESSWETILKKIFRGAGHPGITVDKSPFQKLVKEKAAQGYKIFVLSSKGEPIEQQDLSGNSLFVVGDHIGLPKKDEGFALRYGKKLSLGKQKYLAASCIDIINYNIDKSETGMAGEDQNDGDQN